jgi:hypothetical protein
MRMPIEAMPSKRHWGPMSAEASVASGVSKQSPPLLLRMRRSDYTPGVRLTGKPANCPTGQLAPIAELITWFFREA